MRTALRFGQFPDKDQFAVIRNNNDFNKETVKGKEFEIWILVLKKLVDDKVEMLLELDNYCEICNDIGQISSLSFNTFIIKPNYRLAAIEILIL